VYTEGALDLGDPAAERGGHGPSQRPSTADLHDYPSRIATGGEACQLHRPTPIGR
jgi:hypothetical protein